MSCLTLSAGFHSLAGGHSTQPLKQLRVGHAVLAGEIAHSQVFSTAIVYPPPPKIPTNVTIACVL